jgi:two-component system, sensor histidine kinase and response regulator
MASAHQGKPPQGNPRVFDLDAALNRVEGDRELLEELVRLFLQEYSRQLEAIREGCLRRDARLVERSAHSLKSALGSLSADRSFEAAYRLELLGREAKFTEIEPALARLEDHLSELQAVMQEFLEPPIR